MSVNSTFRTPIGTTDNSYDVYQDRFRLHADEVKKLNQFAFGRPCLAGFKNIVLSPIKPPTVEEESDRDEGDLPSQWWRKFLIAIGRVKG